VGCERSGGECMRVCVHKEEAKVGYFVMSGLEGESAGRTSTLSIPYPPYC